MDYLINKLFADVVCTGYTQEELEELEELATTGFSEHPMQEYLDAVKEEE